MAEEKKNTNNMEEKKLKHMEFIQGVITRMNSNSFSIKTWMITIIAAFLAMYANGGNTTYFLMAAVPTFVFWLLDTYYLAMERQYRELYSKVKASNDSDMNMSAEGIPLNYCRTLFRPVEVGIYLPIILALILAGCLM